MNGSNIVLDKKINLLFKNFSKIIKKPRYSLNCRNYIAIQKFIICS